MSNSTSPSSQTPASVTTACIILSCSDESDASSTGPLLKPSESERGKLFNNIPRLQCNKQASPSAIAFHQGEPVSRSSSTPPKAAKDPLRAFSSEYPATLSPVHESLSSAPSVA